MGSVETGQGWIMLWRTAEARSCKWPCSKSLIIPSIDREEREQSCILPVWGLLPPSTVSTTVSLKTGSRLHLDYHSSSLSDSSWENISLTSWTLLCSILATHLPIYEVPGYRSLSLLLLLFLQWVSNSDYLKFLPNTVSARFIPSSFWILPFPRTPSDGICIPLLDVIATPWAQPCLWIRATVKKQERIASKSTIPMFSSIGPWYCE